MYRSVPTEREEIGREGVWERERKREKWEREGLVAD
jgi:hypothetical protein